MVVQPLAVMGVQVLRLLLAEQLQHTLAAAVGVAEVLAVRAVLVAVEMELF